MTVVVDTSVFIDVLRGHSEAADVLRRARRTGPLQASEVTRLEVLAGMRAGEQDATRALFGAFTWHPLDNHLAELAGELGRQWPPGNRGMDSVDLAVLAVAATAIAVDARLLTRNVKHFPMFRGLSAPY